MSTSTRATTMTAVAQDRYGSTDVLNVSRMPVPAPGPNDVLVRVRAAGVDVGVWHLMTGRPYLMRMIGFGFRGPKARIRGLAFAGRVESVGSAVTRFRPGDDVVGSAQGAFAEYVAAPETSITRMPGGAGYEKSAALPISGVTALQAVKAAGVTAGQRVLVIGAAGGVGTYAVQLAVAAGATVTGVCSGPKAELVLSLAAADVIDYTRSEITAGDRRWDVIIDTAGNRPLSVLRRALTPDGTLVLVGGEAGGAVLGGMERVAAAGIRNRFTTQTLLGLLSKENATDLAELVGLVEAGTLDPAIDTVYPLAEAAAAVKHIADGRARGKVVLSV
ncbi:NAD(P)-dependent alcohol dehydrogenase [Leifsonia sp. NPDC058248]|uniref:NAD(P)-dependent alcohol dehydrogenase n=1 Tax=Leifsonia sp. NPDC058248 TaxID=3346402 RepID=UPI0036DF9B3A